MDFNKSTSIRKRSKILISLNLIPELLFFFNWVMFYIFFNEYLKVLLNHFYYLEEQFLTY